MKNVSLPPAGIDNGAHKFLGRGRNLADGFFIACYRPFMNRTKAIWLDIPIETVDRYGWM